jgi:hypothetical protein
MTLEDHDRILDLGWPDYIKTFMEEWALDDVQPERHPWAQNVWMWKESGPRVFRF